MNLLTLQSMTLEHFRCFDSLAVDFDPQLTIFAGVNGSGKTTVIDAVASLLKYIVSLVTDDTCLKDLADRKDISYGAMYSTIQYDYKIHNDTKNIIVKFEKTKNNSFEEHISHDKLLQQLRQQDRMPVVVCYSAQRNIAEYKRYTETRTTQHYAFENAFSPEIDFSNTLTWFIERSSYEALEAVHTQNLAHRLPELSAVRAAVAKALGDYNEPYAGESPPRIFLTHKDAPDTPLTLEQLSDGYRTMLALVMDLARRMAVANAHVHWKAGETVLHSPGIVLIDEVELHLHPSWQQKVLPTLMEIFPNVQFIVTTHSPQVLTSIEPKHIRLLRNSAVEPITSSTYGAEASRVLEEVLGVAQRPENAEPKEILDKYFKLVEAGDYAGEEAKHYRAQLDAWLYGDPLLDLADMHIQRAERKKARDRNHA